MKIYSNRVDLISPDSSAIFILERSLGKLKYTSCEHCYRSWVEDHKNCVCPCTCFEFAFLVSELEEARDANQLLDKTKLLSGLQEKRAKILFNPNRIAKLINEFGFEILDTLE